MKDGHLNVCIQCTKERVANYRQENIQKINSYDRERGQWESRKRANRVRAKNVTKEKRKEYNNKYNASNPQKQRARWAVSNAVRAGRLQREPCQVCGDKNSHGHHEDYTKPLEVIWLCNRHHKERHRELNELSRKSSNDT